VQISQIEWKKNGKAGSRNGKSRNNVGPL